MKYILYIVIFCAIICGLCFPALKTVSPAIPFLVGTFLFINFVEIPLNFNRMIRKELIVIFLLSSVIMPLFTFFVLSRGFILEYRIGLMLASMAPTGIAMLLLARFVPVKDYDLIVSGFLVTAFGVIIYLPLMTKVIIGSSVDISIQKLFIQTASLVLIPFAAGTVVRKRATEYFLEFVSKYSIYVVYIVSFLIISSSIAAASQRIEWTTSLLILFLAVIAIYLIQGSAGYLTGILFGNREVRHSLALCASSRNIQLILGLALLNFHPLVIVPLVLGIFAHHITNLFWLWLFRN